MGSSIHLLLDQEQTTELFLQQVLYLLYCSTEKRKKQPWMVLILLRLINLNLLPFVGGGVARLYCGKTNKSGNASCCQSSPAVILTNTSAK